MPQEELQRESRTGENPPYGLVCGVKRTRHHRECFTLIELLVVVAIIAVLVAILVPALGKARANARTVVCQANLRELGMLFQVYMDMYDDWLPAAYYGLPWDYTDSWVHKLNHLIKITGHPIFERGAMISLYYCPEHQRDLKWTDNRDYAAGERWSGYCFSWAIHNAPYPWDGWGGQNGKRGRGQNADDVRTLLYCTWPWQGADCPTIPWDTETPGDTYPRQWRNRSLSKAHGNGANFLYVAGNLRWIKDRGDGDKYVDNAPGNTDVRWW